jgi:SnoaL-like polyketide cyclase
METSFQETNPEKLEESCCDEDLHRTEWFVIQPPRTKNLYEAHFLKETHMASKTKTSDPEENKAIALRLAEVFNGRRLHLLEDVLHPEFRERGLSAFPPAGSEAGPGARRKLYEMFYQAIPDARAEVLDVVAEGDKVVILDRFFGTHQGVNLEANLLDLLDRIKSSRYKAPPVASCRLGPCRLDRWPRRQFALRERCDAAHRRRLSAGPLVDGQ